MFEILSVQCPVTIDSAVRCTNSNVELKSTYWFTTSYFGFSQSLFCHLMVALEVEVKKLSRKLFRTSMLDFTILISDFRLSASFQQQFGDSYCFQLILKSILMHASRIWQKLLNKLLTVLCYFSTRIFVVVFVVTAAAAAAIIYI